MIHTVFHALGRVNGLGNGVIFGDGKGQVIIGEGFIVSSRIIIDEVASAIDGVAGNSYFLNSRTFVPQQLLMQSDGVATGEIHGIVLDRGGSKTAELDAGAAGIGDGNDVALNNGVDVPMVNVDATGVSADIVILNIQGVAAFALGKDGVGIDVTGVISAIKHIIVDVVGHSGILKVIIDIQAAIELAVLDLHFTGGSIGAAYCPIGSGGTYGSAFGGRKFDIIDGQLAIRGIHVVIAAGNICLHIAICQLGFAAIGIIHANDAITGTENLVVAANGAVNLVTIGLERGKTRQCTVDIIFYLGHRTGSPSVFVQRSVIIGDIEITFFPGYSKQSHIGFISGLTGSVLLIFIHSFCGGDILIGNITAVGQLQSDIIHFLRHRRHRQHDGQHKDSQQNA